MYTFKNLTLKDSLWINQGAMFSNVLRVEIEFVNPGAFHLEIIDVGGALSARARGTTSTAAGIRLISPARAMSGCRG